MSGWPQRAHPLIARPQLARPLVVHLPNAQMAPTRIKGVLNTVFIALLVRVGAVWGCLVFCGAFACCSHRTYLVLT